MSRKRIEGMRKGVMIIQRHYRAYQGRLLYRKKLLSRLAEERVAHYDQKALVIQCHWRGYWSRKTRHDFYKRKRYIEAVLQKNLEISQLTEEELTRKVAEHEMVKPKRALEKLMNSSSGKHYMLSTETIRGIYNPPLGPMAEAKDIGILEHKIRSAVRSNGKPRPTKQQPVDVPPPPPPRWLAEAANKGGIQGPFKPMQDVWAQRVKKLKPTLRVATSHTSEQDARIMEKNTEWTKRIQEGRFNATFEPKYPYVPSILTSTDYGQIGYGTKTFRACDPAAGRGCTQYPQSFRTVVSPIPIFDEYEGRDATVS